jgi:TatA/E family protein of Tat protein translocase
MPFGLGGWEILIFVGVLALLFGSKGLPQVARRLGTGMREVKDAVAEVDPRRMLEAGEDDKPKGATPKSRTSAGVRVWPRSGRGSPGGARGSPRPLHRWRSARSRRISSKAPSGRT